jgi:hypothetical protein
LIKHIGEAQPRQCVRDLEALTGKAEPFRTSGGKAACSSLSCLPSM